MTRKIHQPIALNARAHEHTRVLRHSIIFVHAYNKVIDAKYRICKIELFSKDIISEEDSKWADILKICSGLEI